MGKFDFYLDTVEVSKIQVNTNNPRGEFVRDNDDQFQYLKRSIRELGLLVPIVVQENREKDTYLLLDGERRYYALRELGMKEAPAHVLRDHVTPETAKELMFHVHTNRKQWDAFQQCKALEPMYEELKKKFKGNESHIAREIVLKTGTTKRTVNARLSFLRWPDEIKEIVYNTKPVLYYSVVEIEDQIVSPAVKNFPDYFKKVDVDEVRGFLFNKYHDGIIHAATEARKASFIIKTPAEYVSRYKYAKELFTKLIKDKQYTFESAKEDFLAEYPEAEEDLNASFKKTKNQLSKTIKMLESFDAAILKQKTPSDQKAFADVLESLQSTTQEVYEQVGQFLT